MNPIIDVNVIAGSGAYQGPGKWLFSDIINIMQDNIDKSRFRLTVTEAVDTSKLYDVYHYFHSTLAIVNDNAMMHRAIVSIQEMSDFQPNYSFEPKAESLIRAKLVTAPSTSIFDTLVTRGIDAEKIHYNPLGVDVDKFKPIDFEQRSQLAAKYNVADDVIRFGFISRYYDTGKKGEDFLVDIIYNGFNDSSKYRFMFVGTGWKEYFSNVSSRGLDPELFEFFERDVDCSYEDYPELYQLMDAVLVTSKVDAGPVCILEALATGLPVIATPTGLAIELLSKRIASQKHDFQNGYKVGQVVSYGDKYGYIDAINNIVVNRLDEIRNLENRNKTTEIINLPLLFAPISKYSSNNYPAYTWNNFCKRFEDLYQAVYDDVKGKMFIEDFLSNESKMSMVGTYSDQATRNLTKVYHENYFTIKGYSNNQPGVMHFKNVLKGQPAVIVGAGPSLDNNLETLKKYQKKVNIISCDAALPVLQQNGIVPDVVVVADPSERQIKNFSSCNGKNFMTIMPTIVHPMAFNEARKNDCIITWYNIADGNIDLCKYIPKDNGYKGLIRPAVLTSGSVFQIALYMGCSDITFIGHDLSWVNIENGYASGVREEKVMYQKTTKMFNNPVFWFYDINGSPVTTELSFITFVYWMNNFLKELDITITNSTGSGILYGSNIIQQDFDEWCAKYTTNINPETFPLLYNIYRSVKLGNDTAIIPS